MRIGSIATFLVLAAVFGAYAQPGAEKSQPAGTAEKPADAPLGNPDPLAAGTTAGGVSVRMAETESVSVDLGMMRMRGPWASGSTSAPDALRAQLSRQLLVSNTLIAQLLAAATSSSPPGDALKSQLPLISQLLASQTAMLQLLSEGGSTQAGGMPGMMGGR